MLALEKDPSDLPGSSRRVEGALLAGQHLPQTVRQARPLLALLAFRPQDVLAVLERGLADRSIKLAGRDDTP